MSGLDRMKARAGYTGYDRNDNILTREKADSFHLALTRAYQAEWIHFNNRKYRCLINPQKYNEDYDQKEISIDFEAGMRDGDVFYWDRAESHWMVYLHNVSEKAYFRAKILKCNFEVEVDGTKYPATLKRGPIETSLQWRQKHQREFNDMNYSLVLYVPKDEITNEFFKRFRVIEFEGQNWRVATVNRYSIEGLIELHLEEYYNNEFKEPPIEEEDNSEDLDRDIFIAGPHTVRPFDSNISYAIIGLENGRFEINSPKVKVIKSDSHFCILEIVSGTSGVFVIKYITDDAEVEQQVDIRSL